MIAHESLGSAISVLSEYVEQLGLTPQEAGQLLTEIGVVRHIVLQEQDWKQAAELLNGTPCPFSYNWKLPGIEDALEFGLLVRTKGKRLELTSRGFWFVQVIRGVPSSEPLPPSAWGPFTTTSRGRGWLRIGCHPIGDRLTIDPSERCGTCVHASTWATELTCRRREWHVIRPTWYACGQFSPRGAR